MLTAAHWQALRRQADPWVGRRLRDVIAADDARADAYSLRVGPIYASFARQCVDAAATEALFGLARDAGVPDALRRLFDGAQVNASEGRPALHTALRSGLGEGPAAIEARRLALAGRLVFFIT